MEGGPGSRSLLASQTLPKIVIHLFCSTEGDRIQMSYTAIEWGDSLPVVYLVDSMRLKVSGVWTGVIRRLIFIYFGTESGSRLFQPTWSHLLTRPSSSALWSLSVTLSLRGGLSFHPYNLLKTTTTTTVARGQQSSAAGFLEHFLLLMLVAAPRSHHQQRGGQLNWMKGIRTLYTTIAHYQTDTMMMRQIIGNVYVAVAK